MTTPRLVRYSAFVALVCFALLPPHMLSAQAAAPRVITGRVTSSEGARMLQGVTVLLRGTRYGTLTTAEGMFRLQIPSTPPDGIITTFAPFSSAIICHGMMFEWCSIWLTSISSPSPINFRP